MNRSEQVLARYRYLSHTKQGTKVISEQTIQLAARLLGEAAKPAKVILFGSYSRGEARGNSDLDFLAIEPGLS